MVAAAVFAVYFLNLGRECLYGTFGDGPGESYLMLMAVEKLYSLDLEMIQIIGSDMRDLMLERHDSAFSNLLVCKKHEEYDEEVP